MSLSPRPHSPPHCQLPPPIPSQPSLPRGSPPKTDSEAEEGLVIRPVVLGKTKAKKRLLAFSIAKNSTVKPVLEKKEKKLKKKVLKALQDPIAATVAAIESEKKEIERINPPVSAINTRGIIRRDQRKRWSDSRSRSRSRERRSRRSRERRRSGGHRSKSRSKSKDSDRKPLKDDKKYKTVEALPDSWKGLKEAGIPIDDEFRRLKWRSSKAKTLEKSEQIAENLILDPIVDFSKTERQVKSKYYAKPVVKRKNDLITYLRHLVHVTNTDPPLVWAASPSHAQLPYYLPREFYEKHAAPQQLDIFRQIIDAHAAPLLRDPQPSQSSWYPRTEFLKLEDSDLPSPESAQPAEVVPVRTRKVSLVNYDSAEGGTPEDSSKTQVNRVSAENDDSKSAKSSDAEFVPDEEDFVLVKDVIFTELVGKKPVNLETEKIPNPSSRNGKYRKPKRNRSSSSSSSSSSEESEDIDDIPKKARKRESSKRKREIVKDIKSAKEGAPKEKLERQDKHRRTSRDRSVEENYSKEESEDEKYIKRKRRSSGGEKKKNKKESKTESKNSKNSKDNKKEQSKEVDQSSQKEGKESQSKEPLEVPKRDKRLSKEDQGSETSKSSQKDNRKDSRRLDRDGLEAETSRTRKSSKSEPVKHSSKERPDKVAKVDGKDNVRGEPPKQRSSKKSRTRVISKEKASKYSSSESSDSEEEVTKKRRNSKEEVLPKKKGSRKGSVVSKKASKEGSVVKKNKKKDRGETDGTSSDSEDSTRRMITKKSSSRGRSNLDRSYKMSSDEWEEGQIDEDGSPLVYASSASSLKLTKSPLATASAAAAARPAPKLVSEYEEFLKQVEPEVADKGKSNDWDNESDVDDSKVRKRKLPQLVPTELPVKRSKKDKVKTEKKVKKKKKRARSSSSSDSESSSSSESQGKKKKKIKKRKKKKKKHAKKSKKVSSSSSSSSDSDSSGTEDSKKKKKPKSGNNDDLNKKLTLNLQLKEQEIARKLTELNSSEVDVQKAHKLISKELKNLKKDFSRHKLEGLPVGKKELKKKKKAKKSSRKSSESESGLKVKKRKSTSCSEPEKTPVQSSQAVRKNSFLDSSGDYKSGKIIDEELPKIRTVEEDSSGWEEDIATPVSTSTTSRSASKGASAASDDHFTLEAASPRTPPSTHVPLSAAWSTEKLEPSKTPEKYSPGESSDSDEEVMLVPPVTTKEVVKVQGKDIYDPLAADSDSAEDIVPELPIGLAEIPLPNATVPAIEEILLPGENIPMPDVAPPLPKPSAKPAAMVSPVRVKGWDGTSVPSVGTLQAVVLPPEPVAATMSPNTTQKTSQVLKIQTQNKLQLRVAAVFMEDSDDEDSQTKLPTIPTVPVSAPVSANQDVTDMPAKMHEGNREGRKGSADRDRSREDKNRKDDISDRSRDRRDRSKERRRTPSPRRKEKRRSPERRDRPRRRTRSPDRRRSRTPERRDKRSRTPEKRDKRSRTPDKRDRRRRANSATPRKARSPSPRKARALSPRRVGKSPSPRRRSPTPVKRQRSPSPRRKRSASPGRRPRSPSPRRRRHPDSPKRRRSKSRSRSPRQRRRRTRSRTPVRRGMSPLSLMAGHIMLPPPLPVNMVGQPPPIVTPTSFPPPNTAAVHQRLSLDQRIELELGVKLHDTPPPVAPSRPPQQYYYPPQQHYHQPHPLPHHYQAANGTVLQVGNIMEVVPSRGAPPPPPPLPQQQIVQVGNVLQVVPARATAVVAPTPQAPEAQPQPPPQRQEIDVLQNPLIQAIRKEREKIVKEKESRRLEREARRKARQAKRSAKLLSVTEKLKKVEHNEGAVLGQDPEDEELLLEAMEPPSPLAPMDIVIEDLRPAGKSILIIPSIRRTMSSTKKSVRFADGLCPGEQSESEGEAILAAARLKNSKEKRYKKKVKKKVKVRIVRQPPAAVVTSDDDDDDNLPPPSPPPGDPPPVFYATFPFGGQVQYPVYQTSLTAAHRGNLLAATAVP